MASNPPGLIAATTLNLTGYSFPLGLTPASYVVKAYVKDEAANVSVQTATTGVDQKGIAYTPGADPVISFVWTTRTSTPSNPASLSDQVINAGQDVYVKWRVTDVDASGLSTNPISIFISTDNLTWTAYSGSFANGANGGCVPDDVATLDNGATGCAVIPAPTSNFFQVRIRAQDAEGRVAQRNGNPLNTSPTRVVAGNLDQGVNSSATSAVFPYTESSDGNLTESGSFVVTDSNDVYIADPKLGLLQIKASDGILRVLVPVTGTTTTGLVSTATMRYPSKVALEHTGNLLILDYDRILRLTLSTQNITTLIGGGSSTAATMTDPLALKLLTDSFVNSNILIEGGHRFTMVPLPDGKIFSRVTLTNGVARSFFLYDPLATNKITQIYPSGVNKSGGGTTCSIAQLWIWGLAIGYNTGNSNIEYALANTRPTTSSPCNGGTETGFSMLDPSTFATLSSPIPNPPTSTPWTSTNAAAFQVKLITGNDGKIYASRRLSGSILRFNQATATYTNLVGTGSTGSCADGTAATSCATEIRDFWVNSKSQIYWWERSKLRTLNAAGNVITVYGQSLSFGDGGSPLLARFANLISFDRSNAGELVLGDIQDFTLRLIDPTEASISKLAGTGFGSGYVANNTNAITGFTLMAANRSFVVLDRATGEPITSGNTNIVKLDRSVTPNLWKSFGLFNGAGTIYTSQDGQSGANIRMGEDTGVASGVYSQPMGWSPYGLVTINQRRFADASRNDVMFKHYDHTTKIQAHVLGAIGTAANLCSPTVGNPIASTSCFYPGSDNITNPLRPVFDSIAGQWVIGQKTRTNIVSSNGTAIELVATLPRAVNSFTYFRDVSTRFLLYCDVTNGRIYKYDLNASSNQETELGWSLPNTRCYGNDLVYDPVGQTAYFPIIRGTLTGLGAILVP